MNLDGGRSADSNFCFSSEEAWDLAGQRARRLVAHLRSDTGRYLLFPDDVSEGACHCPRCAPLNASDQALLYANRLLSAIRSERPEARVSCLAYLSTLSPPERVEPSEGVFLEFAPIRRCYQHAIDDPACALNRAHVRALAEWIARFGGASFHVTEYWLDASRFSGWRRPAVRIPVEIDLMRRDVEFYASRGATSIASYAVMCDEEYWDHFGPPPVREFGAMLRQTA